MYMNNLITNVLTLGGSGSQEHPETRVKYTQASGLADWEGLISGEIAGSGRTATTQIPQVTNSIEIQIGNAVTIIGTRAFMRCSSLTKVSIPNSVTSIGDGAFNHCSGLTSVTIGSGVTSIEWYAFRSCSNCFIFDFRKSTSIPTLTSVIAFEGTPSNKEIIVPDSLYDDWIIATNWSNETNNIVNCIVKASQSSLGTL